MSHHRHALGAVFHCLTNRPPSSRARFLESRVPGCGRTAPSGPLIEPSDRFVRRPEGIGDVAEVDEGREIAVALGNLGGSGRVPHDRDLEALLEQVPQMRFTQRLADMPARIT